MKSIYLYPGQWACPNERAEISTILGSCVAVALYDYKLRRGALNHYLLPEVPSGEAPGPRYGESAIREMIETMLRNGSDRKSLQAKVYGGGNVLSGVTIGEGIGNRNVAIALKLLEEYRIPILAQDVGGTRGRRISLRTDTFEVEHRLQGGEGGKRVDTTGFGLRKAKSSVKVLIVDDSATVRSLFTKIFQKHGIEVVAAAADAYQARELVVKLKPDVLTLDLEMPRMNGVTFLEKLMTHLPTPVVIVSSLGSQGEAAMRTLELGAIEFVQKPSQFDPAILKNLGEMLVEKVKAAASIDVTRRKRPAARASSATAAATGTTSRAPSAELKAILISGYAGSTDSLRTILEGLHADTPPVLVANGTVVSFLDSFITQLKRRVQVHLGPARDGEIVKMGHVYFAPADHQMRLVRGAAGLQISLKREGPVCGQLPSGTVLLSSSAAACGAGTISILLGGFGSDGVEGLQKLQAAGGTTLVENPAETAFPYAPQKAIELGVASQVLSAADIPAMLIDYRNRRVAA